MVIFKDVSTKLKVSFLLVKRSSKCLKSGPSVKYLNDDLVRYFAVRQAPFPMSTSHPPDVIHMVNESRPFPFFTILVLCIIMSAN